MTQLQTKPRSPRSTLLALGLFACACHADDLARANAWRTSAAQAYPASLASTVATQDPAAMPTPARSWHDPLSTVPVSIASDREPPNPFAQLRFRDQQPLVNRLRRLEALPFVTLWDSRAATVYVGVNRDGETGLHLRQKLDDRGSRASGSIMRPESGRAPPRHAPKSHAR